MSPAPASHLERYRPLLRLQVRQLQLEPHLQKRFDSSDLVQVTLLKAQEGLAGFRGQTEAELVKWLQKIMQNVAIDEVRRAHAPKRDVNREQALEAAVAESSVRLEAYLQADEPSPSAVAERSEQRLCSATLGLLPPATLGSAAVWLN